MEESLKYPVVFVEKTFEKQEEIKMHWHNELEIIYIMSGQLTCFINGQKKTYQQGDMFIINSTDIHSLHFLETTYLYIYYLSTKVFQEYHIPLKKQFYIKKELYHSSWVEHFIIFKNIENMNNIQKHLHMYQLYNQLIQECQCHNDINQNHNNELIQDMINYIEKNYTQNITLKEIASEFHFHPHYLSRLFKEKTQISLYQYIQKVRFQHAYDELINTQVSIYDIALHHGFKNVKSFETLFKKIYHTNPLSYRKNLSLNLKNH